MPRKSKNTLADEMYGDEFEYLTAGEKAAVTRAYNAQGSSRARTSAAPSVAAGVTATIGRVGVNGTKTCILTKGASVQDLITQSGYGFDSKKEQILDNDTGSVVSLSTKVKHNSTYAIAVEIKSAW